MSICWRCKTFKLPDEFSNTQWKKNSSRCIECIQNNKARCPACRCTFRSDALAFQHLENGYCSNCPEDLARLEIYKYATNQDDMKGYITELPQIAWHGDHALEVPEYPYQCTDCDRIFQQLSSFLQHREDAHGSEPIIFIKPKLSKF
jgi:uncharacterized C2H2 Zn-finger protein